MAPCKVTARSIKTKCQQFISDRKSANNIVEIAATALSVDDTSVVLAAVEAIQSMCVHLYTTTDTLTHTHTLATATAHPEAEYRLWIQTRYKDCLDVLTNLLSHSEKVVQLSALNTLMVIVSHSTQPTSAVHTHNFPYQLFKRVVDVLLSSVVNNVDLISEYGHYVQYDDIRYYTLTVISTLCASHTQASEVELSAVFACNVIQLLKLIKMDTVVHSDGQLTNFYTKTLTDQQTSKACSITMQQKVFTNAWLNFLRNQLPHAVYKQVLTHLPDHVMPYMSDPKLLVDFLVSAYDYGGPISLLSLNGVFILVNQYNLEYPDFYVKLYTLLEPTIFHVKYRARFFYLTDLFLQSTHLPAYLVAAFIKKLSRLALTAPLSGVGIVVGLVVNLLRRHPACQILINSEGDTQTQQNSGGDTQTQQNSDPYNINETNPANSNAINSSLWELRSLQRHYYHGVSLSSRTIEQTLKPAEQQLAPLLEATTGKLFRGQMNKKFKFDEEVPLLSVPTHSLFSNTSATPTNTLWSL